MTDSRLAHIDQASFLGLRALGHQPYFQGTWVYDREVDLAGLRRFNENLAHTLLGRLVDTSPLPFGRHRWVRVARVPEIIVEPRARDRSQIQDWASGIAESPIDPEHGPGWRLAVLPLTDGGTAVTMPIPHTLGDGLCVLQAIGDAVAGRRRGPDLAPRLRGHRLRRLATDLIDAVRELPATARAVVAAITVARSSAAVPAVGSGRLEPTPPTARLTPTRVETEPSVPFRTPVVSVLIDQEPWDRVARELGGTSNTLVAAVAARLGEALGRVNADRTVRLAVPVSVREPDDTRANALDSVTIDCDPQGLVDSLAPLRSSTKTALTKLVTSSNSLLAALPLTPFLPKALVRRTESMAMGADASPVGCSNYGDIDPLVARIDGADADCMSARLNEPGATADDLDRIGGQAYVLSGRILGRVFLSAMAHEPGRNLTTADVRAMLDDVLAGFGLDSSLDSAV